MAVIRTVLGDISPEELGYTDMHEHTSMDMKQFRRKFPLSIRPMIQGIRAYENGEDLGREGKRREELGIVPPSEGRKDFSSVFSAFKTPKDSPARKLSELEFYTNELLEYKKHGGQSICDCSPAMKPPAKLVQEISRASGVNIIIAAGYYTHVFIPKKDIRKGREYMACRLLDEIENGDGSCGARPGFIKCAVSVVQKNGHVSEKELTALRACAAAAKKSGLSLHIHTQFPLRRVHVLEAADIIENEVGLNPDRVLLCHMDGFNTSSAARINALGFDEEFMVRLMERGYHLGIDTWPSGTASAEQPDYSTQVHIDMIKVLAKEGYGSHLTLGHDFMNKNNGVQCGGFGYTFFPSLFEKLIREGSFDPALYRKLTVENPANLLTIKKC